MYVHSVSPVATLIFCCSCVVLADWTLSAVVLPETGTLNLLFSCCVSDFKGGAGKGSGTLFVDSLVVVFAWAATSSVVHLDDVVVRYSSMWAIDQTGMWSG